MPRPLTAILFTSALATLGATPLAAQSRPTDWAVGTDAAAGMPTLSRKAGRVHITIRPGEEQNEFVRIVATGCVDGDWDYESEVDHSDLSPGDQRDATSDELGGIFRDLTTNCGITPTFEEKFLAGFGPAYARYAAGKRR